MGSSFLFGESNARGKWAERESEMNVSDYSEAQSRLSVKFPDVDILSAMAIQAALMHNTDLF
jgi:hypothetical protein